MDDEWMPRSQQQQFMEDDEWMPRSPHQPQQLPVDSPEPVVVSSSSTEDEAGYNTDDERRLRNQERLKTSKRKSDKSAGNGKKKVKQNYRKAWESQPDLKDWLAPCTTDPGKAKCKYCGITLLAHLRTLKDHSSSEKHKNSVKVARSTAPTLSMDKFVKPSVSREQKIAELQIAAFIASSSVAFRQVDGLVELFKSVVNRLEGKANISKNLKLHRTKCTRLVLRVLGPGFRRMVLDDLGGNKFSLLIDESTDVSTLPLLCVVIRYLSRSQEKMITTFYRLIRLNGKSAEHITNSILAALREDGLEITNLVGLGTDGANVLVGHRSGVITRLQEHHPEIVLVRCVCHSLHKAAEYAFAKLPGHLEVLVRDIYGYFRLSSKRKDDYNQLYERINGSFPRKILKLHGVRWLSLFQCVDVILKQWDGLVTFFDAESRCRDNDQRGTARQLYEIMTDPQNKIYLTFTQWFLKPFIEKNILFQSEDADILKLVNELEMFYISLLRKFIVVAQLENYRRSNSDADMMQFEFERHICHLDMVDFGIEVHNLINEMPFDQFRQGKIIDIKDRCKNCLVEAARQVRERLPCSLNSLRLLESLSPEKVVSGKVQSIVPLLQRFRYLTPDIDAASQEFKNISLFYTKEDARAVSTSVEFWVNVANNKDPAGNGRFHNISEFALNLFSLPFSNASVERVFSAMALIKTNLRNRMVCDTVESVLSVRYGLRYLGVSPFSFVAPDSMLKLFTSAIYEGAGEDANDAGGEADVDEALDALAGQ